MRVRVPDGGSHISPFAGKGMPHTIAPAESAVRTDELRRHVLSA